MREEMERHLALRERDLVAEGHPREEARRRARLDFGPLEATQEECREARGLRWSDELVRNTRLAFRQLRRSPIFALTAIATLGLCIGANTAVFSVVDAVLLRPLPYPEPDRLAVVATVREPAGDSLPWISQDGASWELLRDHATRSHLAVYSGWGSEVSFSAPGWVEIVRQQRVGAGFFEVLGVEPRVGRGFDPEEDRPGGPAVTVLSHHLWQRAFSGEPRILGEKILLRGEPHTIVGILPADFVSDAEADLWTPLRASVDGEGSGTNYGILCRPHRGVSMAEAEAEIEALGRLRYARSEAENEPPNEPESELGWRLVPLQEATISGVRRSLLLMWASVAAVLLIGCVNLAGLLLARSATRGRELSTRLALGGGAGAILRQLLTETLVLALGGALAGLVVARVALSILQSWIRGTLGLWQSVHLDGRALAFTLALTLLTALLFGLFPALRTLRWTRLRPALSGHGGTADVSHRWPQRLLVVGEVALVAVLLVGAGLLVRTLTHLTHLPAGFGTDNLLTAHASLQDARYKERDPIVRLFDRSLERIRRLPGVELAAVGLNLPYQRGLNFPFRQPGGSSTGERPSITVLTYVTPGYIEALDIPLLRGRPLSGSDGPDAARVILVNQTFAETYFNATQANVTQADATWADENRSEDVDAADAIGRFLEVAGQDREIVGIVGDVQQKPSWGDYGPLATMPTVYVPVHQTSDEFLSLVHTWFAPHWIVRSSGSPLGLPEAIRQAIAETDSLLPVSPFAAPADLRARALAPQRLQARLSTLFAGVALLLAAVGIYGLVSHLVTERTPELSVRLALGASRPQTVREAAQPGLVLAVVGVVLGGALALPFTRALQHFLWGIRPNDPLTFAAVGLGLLAVAGVASLVPALRVLRLDPAAVLRQE